MSRPLTVAVFVQDAELYIERCIKSIANANVEVIALDCGSVDESIPQLEAWAKTTPRMRIVRLGRCAQAEALNVAISLAVGELIGFLDARDWLPHDVPEKLGKTSGADVVIGNYEIQGRAPVKVGAASKDELIRSRRRAWGAWFRVGMLRAARIQLGAQSVELDVQLMLGALESANTIATIDSTLLFRGPPKATQHPALEVVSERMANIRSLVGGRPSVARKKAAREEALELRILIETLEAPLRKAHRIALQRLMKEALGVRWYAIGSMDLAMHSARSLLFEDEG